MAFRGLTKLPEHFKFIADGYSAYPLAAMEFAKKFGEDFTFRVTQVLGLTNNDAVSKEYRPFKQIVERLNRTYKASYRKTNGFDNIEGANYDLTLWVTYYNFLRPHKYNNGNVLNDVELLHGADNMPGEMAASHFSGAADNPNYAKKWGCCAGAELLSIEPWNTGTGGAAGCEDMPRKSIDIRLTDHPLQQKRGSCTLFLPSGEDGLGQSPKMGQGTGSLWVLRATP